MGTFIPHRGTHRFISNKTPISWASSPHSGTQCPISVSERKNTPISWASSPHRSTQHSIFVLGRNDTPILWAHPTHGLSHRMTHLVYVLEDVSRSCNHQHSLSTRETFSIGPSLQRKYSNIVLASGLVNISAIFSCVGR
jgi:hypothetical protein